jgi:high affinity Mn2+ porin
MMVKANRLFGLLGAALMALAPTVVLAEGPLYRPSRITAPVAKIQADSAYNWTGVYFGGGAGYTWSNVEETSTETGYGVYEGGNNFFFGELKAGYDVQIGSTGLVAGVFGTWSPNALLGTSGIDDIYSLGGRVGYAGPKMFVYAGGAWVRMETADTALEGWAALAGFERPLFETQALNLTWGLEYKYQDVDGSTTALNIDDISHTVMARINVRFGGFGGF